MSSEKVMNIELDFNIFDISTSKPTPGGKNARKTAFSAKIGKALCVMEIL